MRWTVRAMEFAWRVLPLSGCPPMTMTALKLTEEVTVRDDRPSEVGYQGRVSVDAGLAALRAGGGTSCGRRGQPLVPAQRPQSYRERKLTGGG